MKKLLLWAQTVCERHRYALQWVCVALIAGVFMVASPFVGPVKNLRLCETWEERRTLLLIFTAMYLCVMAALLLLRRELDWTRFGFLAVLVLVALGIRIAVFDHVTADYTHSLSGWTDTFREHGVKALAMDVGDYNLPYQYILLLLTKLPVRSLYAIKMVSIVFDFALALLMMCTVERFLNKKYGLIALVTALLMPTVWFNGAFWAQCDALYCFFVLACVYAMLADRPVVSVAMLTVAFCFKMQTVFFFPLVPLALWGKKYKWRHGLVFPAVYLISLIPALLAGKSLADSLLIYIDQARQYNDRLAFNAANIYQFLPFGEVGNQPAYASILQHIPGVDGFAWSKWFPRETISMLQSGFLPYSVMLILCLVYYLFNHRKWIGMNHIWRLSLAFTLLIPMVLPKMHDRYFMLAEIFSVLYAVRYPKRWYIPVMVIFASFASYMPFLAQERPVDMRIAAAIMIAATGLVLADVIRELRKAREEASEAPVIAG